MTFNNARKVALYEIENTDGPNVYENLCSFTILAPNVVEFNAASIPSLLGLCSFKDGDYLSAFVRAEGKK